MSAASQPSYVVAADGGNSKTDLVLATTDADVLARVAGPGIRAYRHGTSGTAAELADLTRSAVAAAALPADTALAAASYYLANVDFPDEEEAMFTALTGHRVAERLEVRNDTFAVLKAGSPRGWGIAAVAGAGINAVGVYPDGRAERFLGIGEMSGDWGGGRAVAVGALGAAVRAGDGRGPATALRELIASTFGADPDTVAIAADRREITEAQLLAFAPVVFAAATDGDAVATGIVHRLADEVMSFVGALVRRMQLADSDVDVVLGGGTLQSGHQLLLARIEAGLRAVAPDACLRVLDVPPVTGALVSALTLADADPAALARARSGLSAIRS
jgi:N-acetylglucosamine kinase-like BadF-type ATPase